MTAAKKEESIQFRLASGVPKGPKVTRIEGLFAIAGWSTVSAELGDSPVRGELGAAGGSAV